MSRGKSKRNDRSNLEKMKREMRRKIGKAESLASGTSGVPERTEPPADARPELPEIAAWAELSADARPKLPDPPAQAELSADALPELSDPPAQAEPPADARPELPENSDPAETPARPAPPVPAGGAASGVSVATDLATANIAAEAFSSGRAAQTGITNAAEAAADSAEGEGEEREAPSEAARERKVDLLIFQAGDEKFAFTLRHVREIVRVEGLRAVPGAPEQLAGLRSLRGEVLPVVDIRRCFRMPPRVYDDDSRMIVAEVSGGPTGIVTDRITEVANVDAADILPPPSRIGGIREGLVTGIVAKDRDLIMVLDAEKLTADIRAGHDRAADRTDAGGAGHGERVSNRERRDQSRELVVFRVGREHCALHIGHVREILRYGELLRVPNAHMVVEGVMAVRNRLLAVLNPGKIFGLRDHRIPESARIVVVQAEALTFGIVVDHVSEVVRVQENRFRKPVLIAGGGGTDCVSDIAELDRRLAMVLDPAGLAAAVDLDGLYAGLEQTRYGNGGAEHGIAFSREQAAREQIVMFRLDGCEYGVGIERVREINYPDRIVAIPGTPAHIPGMASLRGDLIPLVNLRVLFGFADHAELASAKLLVVGRGRQRAGLLVDEVTDVRDVDRQRFEPVSRLTEAEDRKKYVDRFCKPADDGKTVLMVNLEAVLEGVV